MLALTLLSLPIKTQKTQELHDQNNAYSKSKHHKQNQKPQHSIQHAKDLFNNKRYHKALTHIEKAYKLDQNNPTIWLLFANTYNQIGKPYDALPWYERYIAARPCTSSVFCNAGLAFRRVGRYQEAIDLYKKALELNPNNDNAYFGIGKAYLVVGNFELGLPAYEQGRTPQLLTDPKFLHDTRQIAGKTILIRPDWGLGDMIQFIRYAKLIKKHGGKVLLLPHKALDPLLRSCPYIDYVMTTNIGIFDKQVCPMSLPYLFKTTVKTIPDEIPYLYATPNLVLEWQKKLTHDDGFKIGLCWKSNATNLYPCKDVSLEMFKAIAQIPGISLYSLQKMNGTQQLDTVSFTVHSFGQDFDESHGRFMDTAAIMKNLDLIISVDTATAHLAGALGVPVWILLPYAADWRWLTKRNDSPWYPTARLFRQHKSGDWNGALETVKKELEAIMDQ